MYQILLLIIKQKIGRYLCICSIVITCLTCWFYLSVYKKIEAGLVNNYNLEQSLLIDQSTNGLRRPKYNLGIGIYDYMDEKLFHQSKIKPKVVYNTSSLLNQPDFSDWLIQRIANNIGLFVGLIENNFRRDQSEFKSNGNNDVITINSKFSNEQLKPTQLDLPFDLQLTNHILSDSALYTLDSNLNSNLKRYFDMALNQTLENYANVTLTYYQNTLNEYLLNSYKFNSLLFLMVIKGILDDLSFTLDSKYQDKPLKLKQTEKINSKLLYSLISNLTKDIKPLLFSEVEIKQSNQNFKDINLRKIEQVEQNVLVKISQLSKNSLKEFEDIELTNKDINKNKFILNVSQSSQVIEHIVSHINQLALQQLNKVVSSKHIALNVATFSEVNILEIDSNQIEQIQKSLPQLIKYLVEFYRQILEEELAIALEIYEFANIDLVYQYLLVKAFNLAYLQLEYLNRLVINYNISNEDNFISIINQCQAFKHFTTSNKQNNLDKFKSQILKNCYNYFTDSIKMQLNRKIQAILSNQYMYKRLYNNLINYY